MKRFGTMFSDISISLFRRPATKNYPFEHPETPARLRGLLEWDPKLCTGCGLCVMDCPAFALQLTILDRKAKRYVLAYHVDRCTFCGQCVVSCRQGAMALSNQKWELAALSQKAFLTYLGDPQDVEQVLASKPENVPGKAE